MDDMNEFRAEGNLGGDIEIRGDEANIGVVGIAMKESWTDKETGEIHQKTTWVNIVFKGKEYVANAAKILKKGAFLRVSGKLESSEYKDPQTGKKLRSHQIVVKEYRVFNLAKKEGS